MPEIVLRTALSLRLTICRRAPLAASRLSNGPCGHHSFDRDSAADGANGAVEGVHPGGLRSFQVDARPRVGGR
jgi:hypothetical protein